MGAEVTGTIAKDEAIEDAFITHAMRNFTGARTIEYRVNEQDFDVLWERTRAEVEIDEHDVLSMGIPAGRHEIRVIADNRIPVGEFDCDEGKNA